MIVSGDFLIGVRGAASAAARKYTHLLCFTLFSTMAQTSRTNPNSDANEGNVRRSGRNTKGNLLLGGPEEPNYDGMTVSEADIARNKYLV